MRLTFLGTGTSHGVPPIDCIVNNYSHCPKNVCKESLFDKKHNRTRSSILVEYKNSSILIDCSADFREQTIREKVKKIDAVLLTHIHADHIMGLPDIRSYTRLLKKPLPVFGSDETIDGIKNSFSYIFDPKTFVGGGIPQLEANIVHKKFKFNDINITPIPVIHGSLKECFGFRINNLSYIPDCKTIPEDSMELLKGTEVLILDALRDKIPHSTHMILPESIETAKLIGAKRSYFTHLCHDIHYKKDAYLLEENMDFAFDGLILNI